MIHRCSLFFSICLTCLYGIACHKRIINTETSPSYHQEIKTWRTNRIAKLKAPDGWLSLVGLYWLNEGENNIGSLVSNDIQFPLNTPDFFGKCNLKNNIVTFLPNTSESIRINDQIVKTVELKPDSSGEPSLVTWKSFSWHIIHRGKKMGIRLKNSQNPSIQRLTSIPHYPVDPHWKVAATFVPVPSRSTVSVRNMLGMTINLEILGHLSWIHQGIEQKITVLPGGPDTFFLIIGDQTNGIETYGGGRYLYIPKTDPGEPLFIDFNKAENPPCAFTDFATCLLPPPGNNLNIHIEAGEKMYKAH